MATQIRARATTQEIFSRLDHLIGNKACKVVLDASRLLREGNNAEALEIITAFDSELGGVGLHLQPPNQKLPGPFMKRRGYYNSSP